MEDRTAALEKWVRSGYSAEERDPCVKAWLPLVKRVWARVKISLPPTAEAIADDLLQCGAMGLVQALDSWDPKRNVPFEAWARLKIRGAMLDELRRQDYLSKDCRRRFKALRHAVGELEQKLHRVCTEEELAAYLGIGIHELREQLLENAPASMVFLDGLNQDGKAPWAERLADPKAVESDAGALGQELKTALGEAIGRLPYQERTLLTLVLDRELGHKEAALAMGVSPGRISQIYAKAVLHLQAALAVKYGE